MEERRKDFPMLSKTMHGKPLIYLDTAATAQKPLPVIEAISDFYSNNYGTVHRAIYELSVDSTKKYVEARSKVKNFLNANKLEEVLFTRGTTEAINLAASSFGKRFVEKGDEILITQMEHHSNIVPWQLMCEDRGAILKVAPMNDQGELDLQEYRKLLGPKTKLVAAAHISNSLGTINPIEEMIADAHNAGAKVLIDGAQSAPHLAVDVQKLDADFYAFSGHKLYGPTGIGILYGKENLLNEMPPYQGGGDMIETVEFSGTTYNTLPLKFEAGTPMIAEVIGLGKAIDYIQSIGLESIAEHEHKLHAAMEKNLQEIPGLKIIGNSRNKAGIVSFVVDGIHHLDIGTMLDLKGIAVRTGHHCAQPVMKHFGIPGTARISFGLYNTMDEVESFKKALYDVVCALR